MDYVISVIYPKLQIFAMDSKGDYMFGIPKFLSNILLIYYKKINLKWHNQNKLNYIFQVHSKNKALFMNFENIKGDGTWFIADKSKEFFRRTYLN